MIAQVPGADEAIKAASASGWEAILVVVVVVSILAAFGILAKIVLDQAGKREARMAKENEELKNALIDLTRLVTEATTSARDIHQQTNECLARFSTTMSELCELLRTKATCPYKGGD